jgi:hypothetical protein
MYTIKENTTESNSSNDSLDSSSESSSSDSSSDELSDLSKNLLIDTVIESVIEQVIEPVTETVIELVTEPVIEPVINIDLKKMINSYVNLLQAKMNTDDMIFLKKFHIDEYTKKMSDYVPTFKEKYPFLFKMIISNTDLSILDIFMDNISDIDSGKKSLNDARNNLGKMLHEKFVKEKLNK